MATIEKKPHVIFMPSIGQSHIKAMLKLAQLLHHKGLQITFVITELDHERLLESGGPNCLDGSPGFQFETVPDAIPGNSKASFTATADLILQSLETNFLGPFLDLLTGLKNPPTCIISDGFTSVFTIDAAEKLGIPVMLYWTLSACGFMGFYHVQSLMDKGLVPLKDESYLTNGYLDTTIDWIPGMEGLRLKDFPTMIRTMNLDHIIPRFCNEATQRSKRVQHNIFHTFDELEAGIVKILASMYSHVYTIGPLQLLLDQIPAEEKKQNESGYSLWKEEPECLQWLQSKEPNSVIYVNYGSTTIMSLEDVIEFGWGLASSDCYFLWIIRPDLVEGESIVFPPEFEEHVKNRGFIASWCSQEKVLNHPSVGGFLTHCGWGSTIESLSAGVPMICWPFSWEQPTNCRYICDEWEVGLEMGNEVKKEEVKKLVQELMGEGGHKFRNKSREWQEKARDATGPNGSSFFNVNKLVEDIIILSMN